MRLFFDVGLFGKVDRWCGPARMRSSRRAWGGPQVFLHAPRTGPGPQRRELGECPRWNERRRGWTDGIREALGELITRTRCCMHRRYLWFALIVCMLALLRSNLVSHTSHSRPVSTLLTSSTIPFANMTTMKCIRVHEHGGSDKLSLDDVEIPRDIGDNEVLVKLRAIGVNFIDTYHRTGLYPLPLPVSIGREGSGVIEAIGSKVEGFKVGDRVAFTGANGSYAEYTKVGAGALVHVPDGVADELAAASLLQGLTAHYLACSTFPLSAEHTCLIHAGAGGVGGLLIQMAKLRGATVITTVGTEEKAKLAKESGADHVILYTQEDFQARVMELTNNVGVHVVYDSVGQTTWEKSMASLRHRGMLVLFGNASGPVPAVSPFLLAKKSLFMTRAKLADYVLTREELDERTKDLFGWIGSGKVKVRIGQRYPLSEAKEAHDALEGRQTTGKVLLLP